MLLFSADLELHDYIEKIIYIPGGIQKTNVDIMYQKRTVILWISVL
jgi:hypothetical protein